MRKIILKILVVILIFFSIITIIKAINHINKKEFFNPEYNERIITDIQNIEIQNEDIKNKYQFVYVSDLHASIIDEREKDEQIKQSLIERNNHFTELNKNKVSAEKIFPEIINYANNKNADGLLLGGDIIDSPSDSNFNFLRNNLKNYEKDYLYTLGNHDWSFAWDYHTQETQNKFYPKFNEFMDNVQVSYLEYEDLIILAVNNSKDQIDEEAIEKIEEILEKQKPTIVMLHVPLATKYIADEAIRVRNRASAIGDGGIIPTESTKKAIELILSEQYDVFHIISGHIHFKISDKINEKIIQNVSAPAYEGSINLIKINN